MSEMKITIAATCLLACTLLINSAELSAQKLPSVQKGAVYAPAKVQIDGKIGEWDMLAARNSATQLCYTIANDADNLYLAMQTDQSVAIGKLFSGGITLVIKSPKDKKAAPIKMTYPVLTNAQRNEIVIPWKNNGPSDSLTAVLNGRIDKYAKTIALAGFSDISDPDVSVYNELGLKAGAKADDQKAFAFEFQLPLKYIRPLIDETGSFDYTIVVNSINSAPTSSSVSYLLGRLQAKVDASGDAADQAQMNAALSATDLSGTYNLAKK